MSISLSRYRFTVDDYHRMYKAGILNEDSRTELIQGEVIHMTPIGSRHAAVVNRLNQILTSKVSAFAIISVQNPVQLDVETEPHPDIALLRQKPDFYAEAHPKTDDILLIIEISESSMEFDRSIKLPLYAKAGVPEVWLVDLAHGAVERYSAPKEGVYSDSQRLVIEEVLTLSASTFQLSLAVDEIIAK